MYKRQLFRYDLHHAQYHGQMAAEELVVTHNEVKGVDVYKRQVIGDTVGDPFKDTSGPSLNILIKLCSTVSIVFSAVIANVHLF